MASSKLKILYSRTPILRSFQWTRGVSTSSVVQRLSTPANLIINFVPQQQAWVVERFGRYLKILQPVTNVYTS